MPVRKVVSGGQTGADRGALDAARCAGVPTGGWVPRGRAAEDGRISEMYAGLQETEVADPAERTRRNVMDSDATLIVSHGALRGGTALTRQVALELGRPCLWIDLNETSVARAAAHAREWLEQTGGEVLNVAGPRASEDPSAYAGSFAVLAALLASREGSKNAL